MEGVAYMEIQVAQSNLYLQIGGVVIVQTF